MSIPHANDDAPRHPNDNNNGNMRDHVINNTLGDRDWGIRGAYASIQEEMECGYRRILPLCS